MLMKLPVVSRHLILKVWLSRLVNYCFLKFKAMSNKEMREFSEKLKRGLEIAEKRMLKEKALRGLDVIVCDEDNNILRIPAEEVISKNPIFQ